MKENNYHQNAWSKKYSELTFADDFMFCKVLQTNPELCRKLLTMILDAKVGEIISVNKQEPIEITPDGRGIRMDIYLEDDQSTVYNIEMQRFDRGNLPKRSRYYQSLIDLDMLERNSKFDELQQSYVIFINMFDLFGKGLHKYTFRNRCDEDEELTLSDGTVKIFLNAKGTADDVSDEMKDFLGYLCGALPQSDITREIDEAVSEAIDTKKWEVSYVFFEEIMDDVRKESHQAGMEIGLEKGRSQGLAEGKADIIMNAHNNGHTSAEIAEFSGIPLEQVNEIIASVTDSHE